MQHLVLADAIADRGDGGRTGAARAALPAWSLASVVEARQALRGVALVGAATLAAGLGDAATGFVLLPRRWVVERSLPPLGSISPASNSSLAA